MVNCVSSRHNIKNQSHVFATAKDIFIHVKTKNEVAEVAKVL